MLCDVSEPNWPIAFINDAWEHLTQFAKTDVGRGFWEFFKVCVGLPHVCACRRRMRGGGMVCLLKGAGCIRLWWARSTTSLQRAYC